MARCIGGCPFRNLVFLGIEGVANLAEEAINPKRTILLGFGSAIATLVILCMTTLPVPLEWRAGRPLFLKWTVLLRILLCLWHWAISSARMRGPTNYLLLLACLV